MGLKRLLDVARPSRTQSAAGGLAVKLTMALLLLVVVVAGVSRAQKDRAAGQAGDAATQGVIDVENNWVDALVKADMTALDSIFADSYVDTDEHSHRGGKEVCFLS
jgi:hypothetical protein